MDEDGNIVIPDRAKYYFDFVCPLLNERKCEEFFEQFVDAKDPDDLLKFNIEVKWFEPKEELCVCCGENAPTKVILDPNKFPRNDPTEREDTWDVCDECHKFVVAGLDMNTMLSAEFAWRGSDKNFDPKHIVDYYVKEFETAIKGGAAPSEGDPSENPS